MADYDQAVRLQPDDAAAYAARAQLYLAQRRYAEAVNDYTLVLQLAPSAASYAGRGEVQFARHDWEAALADDQAAVSMDDSCAAAWYGEGRTLDQLGRAAEAQAAYQAYLDRAPAGSLSYQVLYAKKRIAALSAAADN